MAIATSYNPHIVCELDAIALASSEGAKANLPESDTKRLKRNVLTVNAELAEDEPDKEEIEGRLEAITNPINTLSTTLEAAKQLKEQVEPVIEKILA